MKLSRLLILGLTLVPIAAVASPVGFNLTAQVYYDSDYSNIFPNVHLGTMFNVTVAFDTSNATAINPTYAFYAVNGAPSYITATDGIDTFTSPVNGNYLYWVVQHPTVDYVDYFAPSTNEMPNARLQVYFQGALGSLGGNTAIEPGMPTMAGGYTTTFFKLDYYDYNTGRNAIIDASFPTSVPEPASVAALGLGVLGFVHRRRLRK